MVEDASRRAVFLDRDGTLIEDPAGIAGPVRLIPGVAQALARLNAAGLPVVVVTNQAGIARGLVSWDEYRDAARQLDRLLALEHARLDGTYICPHAPEVDGPCPCRKPATELDERAARELGLAR